MPKKGTNDPLRDETIAAREAQDAAVQAQVQKTVEQHEAAAAETVRVGQATSLIAQHRKVVGLHNEDVKAIALLLADGVTWDHVKKKYQHIAEESLEGWRTELEKRAKNPHGERRMPTPAAAEAAPTAAA